MTEWLPLCGWEGHYEVSSDGEIRKLNGGKLLSQNTNRGGYRMVRLSNPRRVAVVHRLVARTFHGEPNAGLVVNHINHQRDDNRARNLEWVTQKQNIAHSVKAGRRAPPPRKGKAAINQSLSSREVQEIRRRYYVGERCASIARSLGIPYSTTNKVARRETYIFSDLAEKIHD